MKSPLYRLFEKASTSWWIMFLLIFIPSQLFIYAFALINNFDVSSTWILQGEGTFMLGAFFVASLVYGIHLLKSYIGNLQWALQIVTVLVFCLGLGSLFDFGLAWLTGGESFLKSILSNQTARVIWLVTSGVCFLAMMLAPRFLRHTKNG